MQGTFVDAAGNAVLRDLTPEEEAETLALRASRNVVQPRQVSRECASRISAGFFFEGKRYQFSDSAKADITAFGARAKFAVMSGSEAGDLFWGVDPSKPKGFIALDNETMPMDAPTASAFADAADIHYESHRLAARALKDMSPIPTDYRDDSYWPMGS